MVQIADQNQTVAPNATSTVKSRAAKRSCQANCHFVIVPSVRLRRDHAGDVLRNR